MLNNLEVGASGQFRAASALLPVLNGTSIQPEAVGEFLPAKASALADRGNIDSFRDVDLMCDGLAGTSAHIRYGFAHSLDQLITKRSHFPLLLCMAFKV